MWIRVSKYRNTNTRTKRIIRTAHWVKKEGHKIILWTNRGDNDEYKVLTEAIDWCQSKGLEFDAINENLPDQKKISGYSPKIMADYYIDDKALQFGEETSRRESLDFIKNNFKSNYSH